MNNYLLTLKKNFSLSHIVMTFFIVFFPIFSYGIFGPTEIFFANHTTFGVVFNEFGWKLLIIGSVIAIVATIIISLLTCIFQKIVLAIFGILSIGGYVQTMFFNTGLDQIGATLDGYIPTTETLIKDGLMWLVVVAVTIVIIIKSKDTWKKPLFLISLILTATQGVAYGTLFISAPKDAFEYKESELVLSGEKQYTVSSNENVIVFILDTVSNTHFDNALVDYPEMTDILTDFTYYNNTDSNYMGTFPSVPHLLTGYELDPTQSVNDWIANCWHNENTTRFYNELHAAGYKVNAYVTETTLFTGNGTLYNVEGRLDNLITLNHNISIDYNLLYKTLLEMSCYRFMPDYFKPYFDVPNTQYASIVSHPDNTINYANPDFYTALVEKGLSLDNDSNYFIIQHLSGIHDIINDENCIRVPNDSVEYTATIRGAFTMIEEYLNQLIDLGVYDNSTIIITADHGTQALPHSIFFIKEAHTTQDAMKTNSAPITLDELLPTIAELILGEHEYLGNTIYDFTEGEQRERTHYVRGYSSDYPSVIRYDGKATDGPNVYFTYTYTGTSAEYSILYEKDIYTVVPSVDAYY